VVEPAPARLHGLALDGLEPDTSYRYAVYDAETLALREEATFRTAPPPGAREIVFAAFGDTGGEIEHVGAGYGLFARIGGFLAGGPWRGRQGELARRVLEDRPELCLHTGDVVYPVGAREAYAEAFFRPFAPLIREVPLFPVVGNHDVMTEGGKPFDEVFHTPANNPQKSPRYYSFDWGDVHFVALDSFSKKAMQRDGPQIQWLMEDLARSRAPWKVCFLHEPPFSEGKKHDSKKVQHRLLPTFEALGVDLVLSGHDHNYQRFRPIRGITYLVTGGGGVSTYDVAASERTAAAREVFHYVRGRADAHRLILEAVDFDGHVFDSVRLEKGAAR
jgi:3',5'-cyclic AMP phosphodiesterase CpdA